MELCGPLCLDEGAGQQQDIWHEGGDLPGMRLISKARWVHRAVSENTPLSLYEVVSLLLIQASRFLFC